MARNQTDIDPNDHAKLMNAVYRHQRFIYDASRKICLLGRDRVIAGLDASSGIRVLEVGCGTGRNLALIGRRYSDARLFGLDISTEMLRSAARAVARAGLGGRTVLAQGDAVTFDAQTLFGEPVFDRIVLSYCLSMIPDWQGALEMAACSLAPGGQIWIVDFGPQRGVPDWFRRGLVGWLARFHVTIRSDLPAIAGEVARSHGATMQSETLYRGFAVLIRIDRPALPG